MSSTPDPSSASVLIKAYVEKHDMLVRYFTSRTRDPAFAQDIVQDLYVRIGQLDPGFVPDNPTAFLFQSARNIWLNHIRGRVRSHNRDEQWQNANTARMNNELVTDAPSAEMEIDAKQRLALMVNALRELPEKTQAIFTLHKIDGIKQADVASKLGISKSSVDKHVASALRHLSLRINGGSSP